MNKNLTKISLIGIFILIFVIRLILVNQAENLGYDAYFTLRNIENIKENGVPLYTDSLTYDNNQRIILPVYYYFLSIFSIFMPDELVLKIIPNLISSLVVFIIFLISKKLTKSDSISLILSFFSAFIPGFFSGYLLNGSIEPFAILLFLITFYLFMDLREIPASRNGKIKMYFAIASFILLCFTHQLSLIFALGLIINLGLIKLLSHRITTFELELSLFSLFFASWFYFIYYKNAFLEHGASVVWGNIPQELLANYFAQFTLIEVIYWTGFITLIFGIYSSYHLLFIRNYREYYLNFSFAVLITLLLLLRIIKLEFGLIMLSFLLLILASHSFKLLQTHFRKTKFPHASKIIFLVITLLFILTSFIQALDQGLRVLENPPSEKDEKALIWLSENEKTEGRVASLIEEGNFVSQISKHPVMIDSIFLLKKNPSKRISDLNDIMNTNFVTEAVRKLTRYDVEYVFYSEKARNEFGREGLIYENEKECFDLIYDDGAKIYKLICELK